MILYLVFFSFIFFCSLSLFGLSYFFKRKEKKKIFKQFELLSEELFEGEPLPRYGNQGVILEGKIKNIPLVVKTHIYSKNKFKSLEASFTITLPKSYKNSFYITREHFLAKLEKLIGKQDIEIGKEAFDEYFLIRGSSEAFAKKILNDHLQEILLEGHPNLDGSFKILGNHLSYREKNAITNGYHRNRLIDLIKIGEAFYQRLEELEQSETLLE